MKKTIYFVSLLCVVAFSSCKKGLLDSVPLTQYSDAAIWQDSVLVNQYVNNIYANIPSEYDKIGNEYEITGNYTDEATVNRTFAPSYTYNQNANDATNAPTNDTWTLFYAQIRNCNVFFDNINKLNASAGLLTRLNGEVRFLRALYCHYLYNNFGRFPIVDKSLAATDNLYIPRNTDAECINYITSELKAAASALPLSYTGNNRGRATRGAALALASRTYLYAGQWQNCVDAAKAVMNQGVFSLFPNYKTMFYAANEYNSEVILDKEYMPALVGNQYSFKDYNLLPSYFTGRNTGSVNPSGIFVDSYEMSDGSSFSWNNPAHAANPYANRDPRLDASIIRDGSVVNGVTVNMFFGTRFNDPTLRPSLTGYYLNKFIDPAYDPNNTQNYSGANFIVIRYAEVLLNYAEAQYNLGNIEEARTYVNLIRARPTVNMPAISAAAFTMDKLRHERSIELAFEGLHLWDVNRWKTGPAQRGSGSLTGVQIGGTLAGPISAHTYAPVAVNAGRSFVEKMYLFPIPFAEIVKYPATTPLVQNTGW